MFRRRVDRWRGLLSALVATPLLAGCAAAHFHPVVPASSAPRRIALADLPFHEYWTGLDFDGTKIGFSHVQIAPAPDRPGLYRLRTDAAMRFHFLAVDKSVTMKSDQLIRADLTLVRFHYDLDFDGNRLTVDGGVAGDALHARIVAGGVAREQTLKLDGPVRSMNVVDLFPVVNGLAVGRHWHYLTYSGETQSLGALTQTVDAFEHRDGFEGEAYRVHTALEGAGTTTWIDPSGRPVLELSVNGAFVSSLESEQIARRDLAQAAIQKSETMLAFSRVPSDRPLAAPRAVTALTVELSGLDGLAVPSDGWQRCHGDANAATCEIGGGGSATSKTAVDLARYLRSTLPVPSKAPRIRKLAAEIAGARTDDDARIAALVDWIDANIGKQAVDVFSALDVLDQRKAECQGHAYLYAALARALGIPTRVVNGLVYSEIVNGFLYHTWDESWVDGRWRPVDPTFGQAHADATHIELIEGEEIGDLVPLTRVMGRLKAHVVDVSPG